MHPPQQKVKLQQRNQLLMHHQRKLKRKSLLDEKNSLDKKKNSKLLLPLNKKINSRSNIQNQLRKRKNLILPSLDQRRVENLLLLLILLKSTKEESLS